MPVPVLRHRLGVVPLLAAGAAPLALLGLTSCNVDTTTTTKAVSYSVPAGPTTLDVSTDAGTVDVTESDTAQAFQVTETWHYTSTQPTARHVVSGSTLKLDYDCPHNCYISYDVTVPRGTAVTADTSAGRIVLTSVSGTIDAHTTAGEITGTGLTAQSVTAHTTAGSIDLAFTAIPTDVSATTTAGSATVRVPGAATYALDVSTDVGHSELGVPDNPASPRHISVHTDAGRARVVPS